MLIFKITVPIDRKLLGLDKIINSDYARKIQSTENKIFTEKIITVIFLNYRTPYSLRHETKFKSGKIKSFRYGIEKATNVSPRLWINIPNHVKICDFYKEFKLSFKG